MYTMNKPQRKTFRDNVELQKLMLAADHTTVRSLAEAIGAAADNVSRVLAGSATFPGIEERIATELKVSLKKLRQVIEAGKEEKQQALAA